MWLYLIAGLIFAGAVGGSYVKGRDDGSDLEIGRQAKVDQTVEKAKSAMQDTAASAIAGIQFKNTTIMGRTVHDVQTNTVYRDCKLTSDGLRDVNDALTNVVSPIAASGVQLPGPVATH